jgi:outer membrane protein assembly factor BamD (BamD/ComL family)
MLSITEYLTHEHRECDELYARVEELLKKGQWEDAKKAF